MSQQFLGSGNQFKPYQFNNPRQADAAAAKGATKPYNTAAAIPAYPFGGFDPIAAQMQGLQFVQQQAYALFRPAPQPALQPNNGPALPPSGSDSGVELGLIEVGAQAENGMPDEHATGVYNIARRGTHGNNTTRLIQFGGGDSAAPMNGLPEPKFINTPQDVDAKIDYLSTDALNGAAQRLNQTTAEHQGNDRLVLNMSLGYSRAMVYEDVLSSVQDNPDLQRQISGGLTMDDGDAYIQKVVDRVDQRMAQSPAYGQALNDYQSAVKQAKSKGIAVVVAAGNEEDLLSRSLGSNVKHASGAALNFLAQSDDVISVAAHDRHGRVADFSSHGNSHYAPDISALGVNVDAGVGKPQDGTSFAAPEVAAAVVEILEKNPDLSVAEVEALLKNTATDTAEAANAEGAGMLNVRAALSQASKKPEATRASSSPVNPMAGMTDEQRRAFKGAAVRSSSAKPDDKKEGGSPLSGLVNAALSVYNKVKI